MAVWILNSSTAADGGLFRWVAALTGSKNAVKGLGFFLGAALLAFAGFQAAVWGMAAVLAAILVAVVLFLPGGLARLGLARAKKPAAPKNPGEKS